MVDIWAGLFQYRRGIRDNVRPFQQVSYENETRGIIKKRHMTLENGHAISPGTTPTHVLSYESHLLFNRSIPSLIFVMRGKAPDNVDRILLNLVYYSPLTHPRTKKRQTLHMPAAKRGMGNLINNFLKRQKMRLIHFSEVPQRFIHDFNFHLRPNSFLASSQG